MANTKGTEGRTPLLTDQDNTLSETTPDDINLHQVAKAHFQNETTESPTLGQPHIYMVPPAPKGSARRFEVFLKVILVVALVSGFLWTGTKLWSAYVCPKFEAMVREEYYRETFLFQHKDHSRDPTGVAEPMCDVADDNHRFDCFPGPGASQVVCEERGCCWKAAEKEVDSELNRTVGRATNVPYCYFPTNYPSYETLGVQPTPHGYRASLQRTSNPSVWPGNIESLYLDVVMETDNRLHFKILDAKAARYEVPIETPKVAHKASHPEYVFLIKSKPFGFVVKRRKTGTVIFDTTMAPLLYGDQFLQLSTSVPSGFVYGLGEHRSAFRHNATMWQQLSLWARDQPPGVNENLYGVHPFFMSLEKDGSAYGVFLLNSNAMDVDLQPYPALTYRTIGGVFDFYVLMGPTPGAVIQQYAAIIGRPAMPPYWALGFHLCRWGYGGTAGIQKVITRMRNASFPYDVQWMDIDYMNKHLDWTYDQKNYTGLPDVVKDLHDHDQHFVIIVDPGISNQSPGKYPPYDTGLKQDVFVKDYKGNPLEGLVWPGRTVYPDFSKPETEDWWFDSAKSLHDQIPFDGLWTDMNEPSNFVRGSSSGCSKSSLDNPPYTPGILGGQLSARTLCPSARHHLGMHYDLHSLYGHMEARASHRVLERLRGKRSLVITRSTFPSTGTYAGHWSGDNVATWNDMYYSIPVMLSFQMFAIPLVGADTCGFSGETTEELCTRWMQLAAFYPFMRNHNMIHAKDQDPASFSTAAQARMKSALVLRYSLLPHLYTLFYHSHTEGSAVVNALSFLYPGDRATYSIDQQFMWGDTLLISPVLKQGQTSVHAYLPNDTWYSLESGSRVQTSGQWVTLNAPLDTINVHVRGGSVISRQHLLTETTTTKARKNPFEILVALDSNGKATGDLYWDDGETINSTESGVYSYIKLRAASGRLSPVEVYAGYQPMGGMTLGAVTVLDVDSQPARVTINSTPTHFTWDANNKVLAVSGLKVNLLSPWTMTWSP